MMIAGFTEEELKRGYRRYCLSLTGETSHIFEPQLGPGISKLILNGDPTNLEITVNGGNPAVEVDMNGYSHPGKTYSIPDIRDLQDVESVCVRVSPLGEPFDCESHKQFRNLKKLMLVGNICHANVLEELKGLESLSFFEAPDLTDLPQLEGWKHLNDFTCVDSDEIIGKDIKQQLKALKKEREIKADVSWLRSKTWFATEYENPFNHWEGKQGKKASKLYRDYLKEIKKAGDEETARECIIRFAEAFNTFDDIETTEREDIWEAVQKLGMASKLKIARDVLSQWFDEARDY